MNKANWTYAAGGVLWRRQEDSDVQIATVHRPQYDDWSLPKGKSLPDEHPLVAACREVSEETGYQPVVTRRLPSQSYRVGDGWKRVDYWAMSPRDGKFAPSKEVDDLNWMSTQDNSQLTHSADRDLVEEFLHTPLPTVTITLVRHGHAGSRTRWVGDDQLRPLDRIGQQQAEQLAQVLPLFNPQWIAAADLTRCVQSVEPLAQQLDLPVESTPILTEANHLEHPAAARSFVQDLVAANRNAVLCSQGEVIPSIIETLADQHSVQLDPQERSEIRTHKGSAWVLSFANQQLVAADYYRGFDPQD